MGPLEGAKVGILGSTDAFHHHDRYADNFCLSKRRSTSTDMLGRSVGERDGFWVGMADGYSVGAVDGSAEGRRVGLVGTRVGPIEGRDVGVNEGG